ncbi:MAG: ketoacyl-ACP synthase III [Lachnospiraceae bacterium]|jgi:3-oxoacyl-(acyl-carrier-protein) synthase III|nr:ketoacyl-ACP synthase III [Lachnospiraceae bacterium]
MAAVICGTGSYAPGYVMDNDKIAELVETNDTWIRERTGIRQRHIAKTETTTYMAAEAAGRAIENAGISPEDIELIIMATLSSDVILPSSACEVQREIGAKNAAAFDINAACSGFVIAYNMVDAFFAAGQYKTALIVAAESLSHLTDYTDRNTCILFGDGAGAAVLKNSQGKHFLSVTHSDGAKGWTLTCKNRLGANAEGEKFSREFYIDMNGQEIFKFAVRRVPELIREVLRKNGVKQEEIAWFVVHQANLRILETVARHIGEPAWKFPMNLQHYGNTSSASVPILLDELNREGRLKKGDKILLAGFGAGLTWSGNILEWDM